MTTPIEFPGEPQSNAMRRTISQREPLGLRTYTPTQAVLARSSGVFHWTMEGRRLYDYSSGRAGRQPGHNPQRWLQRLAGYMGWSPRMFAEPARADAYVDAVTLTAYNAITEVEPRPRSAWSEA